MTLTARPGPVGGHSGGAWCWGREGALRRRARAPAPRGCVGRKDDPGPVPPRPSRPVPNDRCRVGRDGDSGGARRPDPRTRGPRWASGLQRAGADGPGRAPIRSAPAGPGTGSSRVLSTRPPPSGQARVQPPDAGPTPRPPPDLSAPRGRQGLCRDTTATSKGDIDLRACGVGTAHAGDGFRLLGRALGGSAEGPRLPSTDRPPV